MSRRKRRTPATRNFPARRILFDASLLIRFFKCRGLDALERFPIAVTRAVEKELSRRTIQKHAFRTLGLRRLEWDPEAQAALDGLRGDGAGQRDLGEDTSIAACVAALQRGERIPLAVDDRRATSAAASLGIVTLDFLDVLAWTVELGSCTAERGDAIERLARAANGWRPPQGYSGRIEDTRADRVARIRKALETP